jgi:hypothetical protein
LKSKFDFTRGNLPSVRLFGTTNCFLLSVSVVVGLVCVDVDSSVDENSFCSVTFSSLSSSSSVGLPNLKVAWFLLLIDGLSSARMGKLGKFLPAGDKSI